MSREAHVRFWESAGVKLPRATHLPTVAIIATPTTHRFNRPCQKRFAKLCVCPLVLVTASASPTI